MFIRARRLCVSVLFSRYLTNRFLRGVADDAQPKQPQTQAHDASLFDVGFTFVS